MKTSYFETSQIYKDIVNNKIPCYFISPHLDDAVFSSASLLSKLVDEGINVTIINVFTKPSKWPYTLSVYKFLAQCGYLSANKLFEERVQEDHLVISQLGAKVINLGYVDALWRRHHVSGAISSFLSRFIGEISYVYPMYRYGLAQGIVSHYDKNIYNDLNTTLKQIVNPKQSYIFAPLAIGRHVDHLIVRDTCKLVFAANRLVYWSDYPYEQDRPLEKEFISHNNLLSMRLKYHSSNKSELINGYKSQLKVIFGGAHNHNQVTEKYFYKSDAYDK